jgi:hypothetical protein
MGYASRIPMTDGSNDAGAEAVGFSAADLPLSPVFVDFIACKCDGAGFRAQTWPNQLSEELSAEHIEMARRAEFRMRLLVASPLAQRAIARVYQWFQELARGRTEELRTLHLNHHFIAVIGIPRSGGSYLTAELYRALGMIPETIPAALAHDGVPDARPQQGAPFGNSWVQCILRMSEFLTMLEMEWGPNSENRLATIPKKIVKAVYAPAFFRLILGTMAEYIVTVRNPIASCISTIEKSGGLPNSGKFVVRSAIERWIARDIMMTGVTRSELLSLDYFDAYVRYWEQFYLNLALSGLLAHRRYTIVPYGKRSMEALAETFVSRFRKGGAIGTFVNAPGVSNERGPWLARSQAAVDRVAAAWQMVGLPFPVDAIGLCA